MTVTAFPTPITAPTRLPDRKQKPNRAAKAYLERAQTHQAFMKTQTLEYELGKRHLANMMGADPDNFSQQDVDVSIVFSWRRKAVDECHIMNGSNLYFTGSHRVFVPFRHLRQIG